jgi:DNA polymerase-3 subunit alpha
VAAWSLLESLQQEKSSLGYYFSGHPFDAYKYFLTGWSRTPLNKLSAGRDIVKIAGIILTLRTQMTRRGKMAFLLLDDGTQSIELSIFSSLFDANKTWLKEDTLLIAEVKVTEDGYTGGLRMMAENLMNLEMLYRSNLAHLTLHCSHQVDPKWIAAQIRSAEDKNTGIPLSIFYRRADIEGAVRFPQAFLVNPQQAWIEHLLTHTGVSFSGQWRASPQKLSTGQHI